MANPPNKPGELVIRPFNSELWEIVGIDKMKGLEIIYVSGTSLFQARKAAQSLAEAFKITWQIEDVN